MFPKGILCVCSPVATSHGSLPAASSVRENPSLWTQDLVRMSKKIWIKDILAHNVLFGSHVPTLDICQGSCKILFGQPLQFFWELWQSDPQTISLASKFQILKLKGQSVGWEQQLPSISFLGSFLGGGGGGGRGVWHRKEPSFLPGMLFWSFSLCCSHVVGTIPGLLSPRHQEIQLLP